MIYNHTQEKLDNINLNYLERSIDKEINSCRKDPKKITEGLEQIINLSTHLNHQEQFLISLDRVITMRHRWYQKIKEFTAKLYFSLNDIDRKDIIRSPKEFNNELSEMTKDILHKLPMHLWENLCFSGGGLNLLLDKTLDFRKTETDLDLFVFGKSKEEIKSKTIEIIYYFNTLDGKKYIKG